MWDSSTTTLSVGLVKGDWGIHQRMSCSIIRVSRVNGVLKSPTGFYWWRGVPGRISTSILILAWCGQAFRFGGWNIRYTIEISVSKFNTVVTLRCLLAPITNVHKTAVISTVQKQIKSSTCPPISVTEKESALVRKVSLRETHTTITLRHL